MKVFVSWSGVRSKAMAGLLKDWLPDVLSNVSTWVSSSDISAGARWNHQVQQELESTSFGILCLTPTNVDAPWIMFEAGALAKRVDASLVCPFVLGLEPGDVPSGPLAQFQAKKVDESGTRDLVASLNLALGDAGIPDDRLRRRFDAHWPRFRDSLDELPIESAPAVPRSTEGDKLNEVLEGIRALQQRLASAAPSPAEWQAGTLSRLLQGQQLARSVEALKEPAALRDMVARAVMNGVAKDPQVLATDAEILSAKGTEHGPALLVLLKTTPYSVFVRRPGFENMTGNQLAAEIQPILVRQIVGLAEPPKPAAAG